MALETLKGIKKLGNFDVVVMDVAITKLDEALHWLEHRTKDTEQK